MLAKPGAGWPEGSAQLLPPYRGKEVGAVLATVVVQAVDPVLNLVLRQLRHAGSARST